MQVFAKDRMWEAEWFRRNFAPYYEAQTKSRRSGAAFTAANPTLEDYLNNLAKQHIPVPRCETSDFATPNP